MATSKEQLRLRKNLEAGLDSIVLTFARQVALPFSREVDTGVSRYGSGLLLAPYIRDLLKHYERAYPM